MLTSCISLIAKTQGSQLHRRDERWVRGTLTIGRLLQHVLPPGFKRIRHYGLLAPATKTERLATARKLLAMPAANRHAREDAQAFMRRLAAIDIACCTHWRLGRWCVVEHRDTNPAVIATPCWPSAEVRRDVHARTRSAFTVGLRTQPRVAFSRPRRTSTPGRVATLS